MAKLDFSVAGYRQETNMTHVLLQKNAIINRQIAEIQQNLGAALCQEDLQSELVRQVLERQVGALTADLISVVRKYVEANRLLIVRHATVDPSRTPEQALDATGRRQYVDREVVALMPRAEGPEATLYLFNLGRCITDVDLENEYELRGLKPADPYSLAAVNEADYPNATHWKGVGGNWCYAAFHHWRGAPSAHVFCYGHTWRDYWWFAGVCR